LPGPPAHRKRVCRTLQELPVAQRYRERGRRSGAWSWRCGKRTSAYHRHKLLEVLPFAPRRECCPLQARAALRLAPLRTLATRRNTLIAPVPTRGSTGNLICGKLLQPDSPMRCKTATKLLRGNCIVTDGSARLNSPGDERRASGAGTLALRSSGGHSGQPQCPTRKRTSASSARNAVAAWQRAPIVTMRSENLLAQRPSPQRGSIGWRYACSCLPRHRIRSRRQRRRAARPRRFLLLRMPCKWNLRAVDPVGEGEMMAAPCRLE
jgi:hypothetical protein